MSAKEKVFVIGMDESSDSDRAFQYYADNVHEPGHSLLIVHAVHPRVVSTNVPIQLISKLREQMKTEEEHKMKQLQEKFEEAMRSKGIRGRINMVYYSNKPGKILCEIAKQQKCCLLILGHPAKSSSPSGFGSTVDYVLKKAKCPILVTRQPKPVVEVSRRVSIVAFETEKQRLDRLAKLEPRARTRRFSVPAMHVPITADIPLMPASGEVMGSAAPSKNLKQRRHSSVINPTKELAISMQFSKLTKTVEEDEEIS